MTHRQWVAVLAALAAGCSDALEQNTTVGQFVAVATSGTSAVTLISASDFSATVLTLPTIGAANITGRGSVLAITVDSGRSGTLALGDLAQRRDGPIRLIKLDTTATLSGAAIANDSLAWVADSGLARLWRVRYRTGDTASVLSAAPVARAEIVTTAGKVFVPATVTGVLGFSQALAVLDGATGAARSRIFLSIGVFRHLIVGGDSLLYVVSDTAGSANRLAIVDPVAEQELVVIDNVGPTPGRPVFHPSGRLLIPTAGAGIVEVNTLTRVVSRGPGQGIRPQGDSVIVALAVDQGGRVYALDAAAGSTGIVRILAAPPDYGVLASVTVGAGPMAAAVAAIP
ncbi:MAG TPA: hypothetical protein VEU55_06180 [Gemmatimonadales bacterium]|nr:hypothetical protein [Gemmatimonadales bacterium]